MKKVIGGIAGLFFGVFCIGVIGLMISLTYSALGRIFPNDFENQMWGLVIFDIATLAWAFAFVYKSHSVGQYVASGSGFLVGLIGTLGMIAAEVILSGQNLTGGNVDVVQIGQWMLYGFIGCTALHVILVYAHHAAGPELAQQIGTGISRGQIRDRALHDAEKQLEIETAALAQDITADIVASVRRDLQLPIPADPRMPFLPAQEYYQPPAAAQPVSVPVEKTSFSKWLQRTFGNKQGSSRYEQAVPQVEAKERPGAPDDYGPLWKSSTDITPTLDAYAWYCEKCEGSNHPYTRKCQWCQNSRTNASPVTAFADTPPKVRAEETEDNSPISDDVKRMYAPGTHFRDGTVTPTDLNDPFWSEHPHHMTERWGNKEAGDQPRYPFRPE